MAASVYDLERESCKITIGGVTMTMEDYKRQLKEQKAATKKTTKRKTKKTTKEVSEIAAEVEKIVKSLKVLKSLCAYYDHAYRQWGTIANEILKQREIRAPFVFYRTKIDEVEQIINDIEKCSKRNEKAVYQYIEKLSWRLDDAKSYVQDIMSGVSKSGICQRYKDHESINGKGRRLGLNTLMIKAFHEFGSMEKVIKELESIAKEGVDIMNIESHLGFKERKRVLS